MNFAISDTCWIIFLFCLGASVGSFLNVVVYRLPQGMSIVQPGSHCFSCQAPVRWYDNIPILAWFYLRGRCRNCGAKFSIRYALVELFTAILFVAIYRGYFYWGLRVPMPPFTHWGWVIYAGHMVLVCALLAATLIDAEHWIIPLSVSYTAALVGFGLSAVWPYCLEKQTEEYWRIIPYASPAMAAAALGGGLGLMVGLILLKWGVLTRSFAEIEVLEAECEQKGIDMPEVVVAIRREMLREVAFLAPAVVLGLVFMKVLTGDNSVAEWWGSLIIQQKWCAGLLGSAFGFMIGGGVVWATRIAGSVAFGKEAMGLGDVHLMAAVGAVLGWLTPTVAFFVAPFFGLGWALLSLVIHRRREIPYGPWLSLATVLVMVFFEPVMEHLKVLFVPPVIP